MIQTRKTIWKMFNIISLLLALCVLLSSCLINMPTMKLPFETTPSESELNEFRLSNKICVTLFGVDSQTFYETKGKDTLLENGYTKAAITDDVLVLYLTDSQVDSWRNSNIFLQILQKIMGDDKEIVPQVIVPTDPVYSMLYEDADLQCGFEISDDYSKIVAGPGDDKTYSMIVPRACFTMQVLQGKPSDEISVEYLEYNADGVLTSHFFLPTYMFIFQNLDECKQLKSYEQADAEIVEYLDPNLDESYKGLEYRSFWGMKYQSANLEYEIYAYEFTSKDNALKYYIDVTDDDKYAERLPVEDSDRNALGSKTDGEDLYQITVIEGNKAYRLLSSNLQIDAIDEMLSKVFSVKI